MTKGLAAFEAIVRRTAPPDRPESQSIAGEPESLDARHPFEERNIHPDLPTKVRKLYDDGHYSDSVFTAFKFIESEVKRISGIRGETGYKLMARAFGSVTPAIALNAGKTDSELDEQRGFRGLFAGATVGIRNPRGHEVNVADSPDETLDYLALASLLLRRLDAAGLRS